MSVAGATHAKRDWRYVVRLAGTQQVAVTRHTYINTYRWEVARLLSLLPVTLTYNQ